MCISGTNLETAVVSATQPSTHVTITATNYNSQQLKIDFQCGIEKNAGIQGKDGLKSRCFPTVR